MLFAHVLLTIVLCLHSRLIWCTDLSVVYKHNIYHLKHADASSPSPPQALLTAPLHYPVCLAYAGTRSSDGDMGPLLLVTDTRSGQASVFGVSLGTKDAVVEPVMKRSSTSRDHLAYDRVHQSLYLSWSSSHQTAALGMSQLPEDLSSKWAPQPTPLARAGDGKGVQGLALDPCNRVLYWSEGDGKNSSAVRWRALDGDGEADTLLQAAPGIHYQGIHYDPHSKSLLVAVTNSSNPSESSCSFLSVTPLAHPNQTATSSSNPSPGSAGTGLRVETIATPLDECFPYAVTADEHFLYYSDWARQGLMRLEKGAVESNATRLLVTPGVQSQVGWHPGALGMAIIPEKGEDGENCESTGGNGPLIQRGSLNHETSTVAAVIPEDAATAFNHEQDSESVEDYYTTSKEDENYLYADYYTATVKVANTKNMQTIENTSVKSSNVVEKDRSNVIPSADVGSALPNENLQALFDVRSSTSATTESREAVTEGETDGPATDNVMVSVRSHSSEIYDYTVIGSLSHLSHGQLERVILWLSAACCLFFITSLLLALKVWAMSRYPACGSGYSIADDTTPLPAPLCGGRGNQNASPSYYTQHGTAPGMCNGSAEVNGSTTDVIIDLSSQNPKCGGALPSTPSGGANPHYPKKLLAGKPKKRFGPSKGGIKHLISKSLVGGASAGASGGFCPGLKRSDDDGVLLNIEDCCQMTLCDTPCYSSVQKEGKRYQGGRGRDDDKKGLLDDDEDFVPSTDC